MKIKTTVFFDIHKQYVSLWTIILLVILKVNPSRFENDVQFSEYVKNVSSKQILEYDVLHRRNKVNSVFQFKHTMYNVTIPENSIGKTYAKPASHEDLIGLYVKSDVSVKYRIISGDRDKLFKVEERIVGNFAFLLIRTRTSNVVLNREKNEEYILKIKASFHYLKESSSLENESETSIHIRVLDRNDLSPLFYPTEYSKVIPEDLPIHKSILKVTAEDADLGINGEIYYSLLEESEYFSVHPTSGVLTLTKPIVYEQNSRFEIIVLANDRGSAINHYSHQASRAKVLLLVEQVNLHTPEIYVKTLSSISTNFSSLTYGVIGVVRIIDKDPGRHGQINKLEIVDGDPDGNFFIKPTESDSEYFIEIHKLANLSTFPYKYNLTLRAEDRGTPVRYSYKTIPIQIHSESYDAPIFTKQLYEVSIPETSPPNMPIIRLKVTAPNAKRSTLVFLEIVGGNEGGEFRINPDTGMLYTVKPLDAESKSFYTLTVSAIDQAHVGVRKQSSAKVKINIQDMNDNDPIFEHLNTTIEINENELAGSFVVQLTAKDKDSGENSYISYSIANLNEVPFEIDHFYGIIKTTALIDYETMRRSYILKVRASDWGLPYRRQTELELLIKIRDVNDNRPQFERINCIGKILRNTAIGIDIFTFSAVDFDAGDYITYRLVAGNEDGCFNLDSTTGVLSIGCDLNDVGSIYRVINVSATDGTHFSDEMSIQIELVYEERNLGIKRADTSSSYGSFECRETGVARRSAEILATGEKNNVDILDKTTTNDLALTPSRYGENIHKPEFVNFPQELKINESVQLGETVAYIKARDRDLGYNGKLIYAIADGDYDSVFRIDPDSGELQIIGYVDRERQDEYVLNITVYDLGQPQKSQAKMIAVVVLDNNDNPPVFQKSLSTFRIPENALNGTKIVCVNATDVDIGKNAEITYQLQTEINNFYVNKTTGCVYLINSLDRENRDKHELVVIAKDNGVPQLSAESVINILVEDVNDNAPIFGLQEFIFKVREDIPRGTVVAWISATDFDLGPNGEVYFSLKEDFSNEGLFKIDKYTGIIRTQGYLDYETRQVHNVIISAIDRGTPSLTSDMPIVIEVIDVNENRYPPEFDDFVYIGKIKENAPKETFIMNVTAKDLDTIGPDASVSYSIRGGDGLGVFSVNDQGSIYTTCHLDAETKNFYWLTLCAQDSGIVPLSSCVQVYIEVENENDNVPLTDKPVYYLSVPEGAPPHKVIKEIKAIDRDNSITEITYKIISGNPEGFFALNYTTGELTTTERKLDRENQAEHILEIAVYDNGKPPLSSTTRVVVNVEDINDHSPEFDQRFYKIQVPSTIAVNESIFQVHAMDKDAGENARISYFIKSGKGKNKFRMDTETGNIYVLKPMESDTEYDLNIRADDNGTPKRSQTSRLNIVVIFVNEDNPTAPVVKSSNNVIDVTETDRPGFLVTTIQAFDEDGDHLWYYISDGDERNEFFVGRDNGNVILAKELDWETQQLYNLTVCVTDGVHVVRTQLCIKVVDINDNRPEFTNDTFFVNISENIEEESVIMQLHATDKDEDKKIFYTLHAAEDPSSLSLFRIDSVTGNVLVTERLDFERQKYHILIVTAKDQGTPAKRNYAKIVITVYDHNDHFPEFTSKIIQSRVLESAAIGSKVAQLIALDRDYGKNAEIIYSIVTGNVGNTFNIESSLGIITIGKELNINEMQEYMLQVKATDLGEPPLSSQIPVHIIVTMSDNDAPRFISPVTTTEMYENLPAGTLVAQVEARSSSSVSYDITHGNAGDFFSINPSTGVIYIKAAVDYEKNKFFNLTISGTNMAMSTAIHFVAVHILDVNDNVPSFDKYEYFGVISEGTTIGSFVFTKNSSNKGPLLLNATDLDVGKNGIVEYTIIDEIAKKVFKIDPLTGSITLMQELDYETTAEYVFPVMVTDMGTPKLFSKKAAVVHISVENVNDCPPVFKKKEYNCTLYLPTYANVIVTQVNATDADKDENSKIRYDILDGNTDDCFDMSPFTGIITSRNVERLKTIYTLHVRASDGLYSTICQVNIHIEDLNDSGLVFQKAHYDFSATENSTKVTMIGLVNVVGNSLLENVEYRIINPTDMFQVGKTSGAVSTTGVIFDRETQDHYVLVVEALSHLYDNNRKYIRRAHVLVNISILDVNDNCPIFVNLPYYATVAADDPKGSIITTVKAIDLDKFENGEVRYEMKKGNGELFKVDRKTGELILKQQIESHNRHYDIIVSAFDGALTPCSTDALVQIKVVDKAMPIFDKQFYSYVVREDVEIFSALSLSIQADSPLKRSIVYSITKGNDNELFEIDYRAGVIHVVNDLDYEKEKSHDLVVRATDMLSGIYAEVPVSINIEDANDCYPEIEKDNYYITVSENVLLGTQILKINASDCDSDANGELSYTIDSKNASHVLNLFYIDTADGSIYVKNILDYEEYNLFHIIVIVTDHGIPSLSSHTNIWITLRDINDNSPRFIQPSFSCRLSIDADRGQFVTIAKAYDVDVSDNSELIYKIVSGNELQTYSIGESTGIITLQNLQNFTDDYQTILNISVTDRVHTTYARVKIVLIPENIHKPMFFKSLYEANIIENELAGVDIISVQAIDKDFGKYALLSYDILSDEMKDYFKVNESNGSILSKITFDREKRDHYDVVVRVIDGGGKFDYTLVKVKIDDKNDNSPLFNIREYKKVIRNNLSPNSTIFKIKALDLDDGENGALKYKINADTLDSIYSNYFHVDDAGNVKVADTTEQFSDNIVQFFVRAYDNGKPQLSNDVPVSLQLISPEIEIPQFEKEIINISVLESIPPGSVLTKLVISGNYSLKFSLLVETPKFIITESGEIILAEMLDREEASSHYLAFIAETATVPILTAFAEVNIFVKDENDNAPIFDSVLYNVEIAENVGKGTSLLKITAKDLDTGLNGDIRYFFEDDSTISDTFEIDFYTGWITSLVSLDRELHSEYYFNVLATDNGHPKHISKAPVVIKLIDYNDNPPKFKQQHFEMSVYENALPGTVLTNFMLTDMDSEKTPVDFFITHGDEINQFQIGSTGELFVSKSLDREIIPSYNLTLIASDGKFIESTHVFIKILDVNDNVPVCLTPRYKITINESIPIGTTIVKVIAKDVDENAGENLRYYLTGTNSEDFVIEKDTGIVKVARPIDRELHSRYMLVAHVQDGQELSRECMSEIYINVKDINDNKPEFSLAQYVVSVYENAQVNTIIGKIHATDKDIGINRKVSYAFLEDNGFFSINAANGVVKLVKNLDRETISAFNISIKAEDHGVPKLFSITLLVVNVLDVNDNPPEFSMKQYLAYLPENALFNTAATTVHATSKDIGINADISYYIVGGNEQKKFTMDANTGVLSVNDSLDYEKTKSFYFTIQAIDGGVPPLSSLAYVNISITDVNDNQPKFSQNIFRAEVLEDIALNEKITKISATDEDSGENGKIRYSIVNDKLSHFSIDTSTGDVIVTHALDREITSDYLLEVKSCDNGVPELCSFVHLNIIVLDINDNPPLFSSGNYSVVLQENKELGYTLLNFEITDADDIPNTLPYTFDFRNGNEGGIFRLEQDGTLRTAARFNHKICDMYNLKIRVFDNGTPPLFSDTWVQVKVIEESQYPPVLTPLEISVNSFNDDFAGGYLGSVYASDQDKYDILKFGLCGTTGETYETTKLFNISEQSGKIFATNNLDGGLYKLNVSVTDGKFTSHAMIRINVELVSAEMVENAAVLVFSKISPETFILSYRKGFIRVIRSIMRCRQKDVIIITLQNTNRSKKRQERSTSNNLDVVFAVRKQQIIPNSEAYFSSEELYSAIINNIDEIEDNTNLVVEEIVPSTCLKDSCVNGKCISRIVLNKNKISTFSTDVISFATPSYTQINECQCRQGFDGVNCDEPVNACSSDPCPPQKNCWPAESDKGYQCICPRGYTGQFCENKSAKCHNSSCLISSASVSFSGKSYAHYKINKSTAKNIFENQSLYSLKIRTVQQTGTLLYASGKIDYNILEIVNGIVQYRFDLGSGEGAVSVSSVIVSDGEWHVVSLERIFNSAKLTVDNKHVSQGSAPGVNGLLNIQSNDIFIGAEVKPHPSILGFEDIQRGFVGCISDIRIAREQLPLYISGGNTIAALKRFTNVEFMCDPASVLIQLGVCGAQPCLNGGVCTELGNNDFTCMCHARFTGPMCEFDLDPCASDPCLFGGRCEYHNLSNYTCNCPTHLSGKRCEYGKFCTPNPCKNGGICEEGDGVPHCMCRGYTGPTCEIDVNECDNQPCGNGATCINEAGSFRCICPSYLTGASCGDPLYSNSISTRLKNLSMEHITGLVTGVSVIFVILIIVLCTILIRTNKHNNRNACTNRRKNYKEANLNSLISKEKYNIHNTKMSNLEVNNRPVSFTSSGNENIFPSNTTFVNNLDILRSYGSAGDELENVPFEFQKITRTNQHININSSYLPETEACRKENWGDPLHLKTFSENKLNNEKKHEFGLQYNRLPRGSSNHGRPIQVHMPTVGNKAGEISTYCHGQYHWDCSDWVTKSQNPLPDITEVPGAEIADSSSFHSNESNESKLRNSYSIQNIGEVDPIRDITTLNEDYISEGIDSELENFIPSSCRLPLSKSNSLSRLSPLHIDENEDYKLNTVPLRCETHRPSKVYLHHPDRYLPPLKTPSETEGEISSTDHTAGAYNEVSESDKNNIDRLEQIYIFGNMQAKNGSNSDVSVHLCEIEESELEDFFPNNS